MNQQTFKTRLKVLRIGFMVVFGVFCVQMFSFQIMQHEALASEAREQHERKSVIPAQRGKILVRKNRLSQELTPLATNNTLKMLYIDPVLLNYPSYTPREPLENQTPGNPPMAAQLLAPILIHAHCEKIEGCEIETDKTKWSDAEQMAIEGYTRQLTEMFFEMEVRRVVLATEIPESRIAEIADMGIAGITATDGIVIADPVLVEDKANAAAMIAPMIDSDPAKLEQSIRRRQRRYVEVTNQIVPEVSDAIEELKQNPDYKKVLRGVVLKDEHWRYYPEKELAAQVIGFVDNNGSGQYGIEERFDELLRGREGSIYGAANAQNQFIGGGTGLGIEQAVDGTDVVLTIDRVLQEGIQQILEYDTQTFGADSGQIIVVDPRDGKLLGMVHFPTFDPNEFGRAYEKYEIDADQKFADEASKDFNQRIPTVRDEEGRYYRYYNKWGPEVFRNKLVSDVYEPGSVMKAITVAAALNAGEVEPNTTFNDPGPVDVLDGEFTIKNADDIYAGRLSVVEGLIKSRNTMIAYITRKMGAKLTYEYLKDFGFGEYTDIDLPGEQQGVLEYWQDWDESELITRGFGQGISSTPLQMVMGFAALANGGYVLQPRIIEEIRHPNGVVEKTEREVIKRAIGEQSYLQTKAMLRTSIDKGYASKAQAKGYKLMGKTGTSQTYDTAGRALRGEGTTITSFAGYGPYLEPEWVVLIKYDYPTQSQWGSDTAAVTFSKVARFLMRHYGVPPESE